MLTLIVVLAALYGALNLFLIWVYPRQLFPYEGSSYTRHSGIEFISSDSEPPLAYRYFECQENNAPLLFYCHGNGEDIGQNEERYQWFLAQGYSVFAFDYPGYGLSGGRPSARSLLRSGERAWREARTLLGTEGSQTVLWGRSLGGAIAIHLATLEPFRGLVLESPFCSVFGIVTKLPLLVPEPFPNEKRIPGVQAPVSVVHGTEDEIIPLSHAQRLTTAAPGPAKLFTIVGGTHNNLLSSAADSFTEILAQLKSESPSQS